MASGKETPRQKMIGMMYLVLTALLALNVSQQILKGFVTVDENIEKSKDILTENNAKVKEAFEEYVKQGNYEAQPYLLKAIEAQKYTRELTMYIDSMKHLVVGETEKINKADTAQIRFMKKLDDFDTPTYLFIGSDEANPISTPYSANALKKEMINLYNKLSSLVNDMQKDAKTKLDEKGMYALKEKLNSIKPSDKEIVEDGVKMNWELQNFYHLPLAAVVTNLDKMEADIKNIESEFLHVFSQNAMGSSVRINSLTAQVISPKPYVQTGQEFNADILLAAGSTNITSERMQVLVGAEYDSINKKLSVPGTAINIQDGIGKFSTIANATGQQELKGIVAYRNTQGIVEYYPFQYQYMVSSPFAAVSADNMNVFYVGVNNPISVSAAGFAPNELQVSINGCGAKMISSGAGKYEITATSAGTCTMTIAAKTAKGLQNQGPPKVFRVRNIPPPIPKINGVPALGTLEFTKTQIAGIEGIGAEAMGFVFPVNMKVLEFDVITVQGGNMTTEHCSGPNLNLKAKQLLEKLNKGQKAWFENIKIQSPSGITNVNATIKVK